MVEEKSTDAAVQQTTQPLVVVEKGKNNKGIYVLGIIALVAIVVFGGNIDDFNFLGDGTGDDILPADIELYKFIDVVDDCSDNECRYLEINVGLWLINFGEENAKNITVYVRARDYRGKTVYDEYLDMTTLVLRPDETCSGTYTIRLNNTQLSVDMQLQKTVAHTIELSWDGGRESYLQETIL